ncbi:ATP-dependent DNA helicase RecG [Luteococcus japonicus]|uniref:ATP-dependent DNA helicase RecG n=1 Tax=Luteococcus japonicus LSP_Lj1 TaxID=1255658 RepID=A0A1R4J5F1_9ACTN|nr:ATP-dependent DNA helicase RecG [Luteococcus japonicus]SJN27316.1 ATP-dependent DNA helicase RecG [Luteococcus japonicus LSP_Lj1]
MAVPSSTWQPQWRTETFAELNRPLGQVIGAPTAKILGEKLRLHTVGDLMRHLPRRYLSGTENSSLADLPIGEDVAVMATVGSTRIAGQVPRQRLEVTLTDGQGTLGVTFFGKAHLIKYWSSQLVRGSRGIFVGKVGTFMDRPQLTHPNYVILDVSGKVIGKKDAKAMVQQVSRSGLVGIYPATAKMPTWEIGETVQLVHTQMGRVAEPLPDWLVTQEGLMGLDDALVQAHQPISRDHAEAAADRLLFDEALQMQLTMAYRRHDNAHFQAPSLAGVDAGLLDAFDARLPFTLTDGQRSVGEEIFADIATASPMQRLLQGEVGSGKTMVAVRAMLRAVDSGKQAVLLAPTEVLSGQHFDSITAQLGDLAAGQTLGAPEGATEVVLLTGSMSAVAKRNAMLKIASGQAGIVIGTHALLADKVSFADLGLVVVDEQHRFGVEQRAVLNEKAELRPHVLVMTATPIPRSVAMTVFGDLVVSTLTEVPAGRQEVQTNLVNTLQHPAWLPRAWQRIREEVEAGHQAFVVCPRIDPQDSEVLQDPAAKPSATVNDLFDELRTGPLKGLRLEMLHGRLTPEQKDAVMNRFAAGEVDVLVSTTVIEVGVDVPNATVMVVMDADRFGISQLHQLRGRIGRGGHAGLCLLITQAPPDSDAMVRLRAVEQTRDGFQLAELDLAQRREGNVLGANQSGGRSALRLLKVIEHADLIAHCRDLAERLVAEDPDRVNPYLADMVTQTELLAAGDWLEKA